VLQVTCRNIGCERARFLLTDYCRLSCIDFIGSKQWRGRQLRSALLLGLFLSVLAMASSATLHKVVHPNATQADHSCAATLLSSGQVDSAPSLAVVASVPLVPLVANRLEISFPSVASFNLPLSRGPPALLS